MSKKLYIIGNGFDRWHNLPTSYENFNCFMCRENPLTHDKIGRLFNPLDPNMLWQHFEKKLGKPDILSFAKMNIDKLFTTKTPLAIENENDTIFQEINDGFHDWATQIDYSIENKKHMCRLCGDKESLFLSFNFTNTLELFYGVNRKQICYIHGETSKNNFYRPVVGHGDKDSEITGRVEKYRNEILKLVKQYGYSSVDTEKVAVWSDEIINQIIDFIKDLRKKTSYYLDEYNTWFGQTKECSEVYVLGHSLCDIDKPYFKEVYEKSPQAKWYVSYKDEDEKGTREQNLHKLLDTQPGDILVELIKMDDLCNPVNEKTEKYCK